MTNKEREAAFRAAIAKVCVEFHAELEVTDDGKPYGMASPILRVSMDSLLPKSGDEVIAEYFSFEW